MTARALIKNLVINYKLIKRILLNTSPSGLCQNAAKYNVRPLRVQQG